MLQLSKETFRNLHLVLGFVNDKDLESLINLFPEQATYYFCTPIIQRGKPSEETQQLFNQLGYKGEAYASTQLAFKKALYSAEKSDIIYVGGSTFVVAEII